MSLAVRSRPLLATRRARTVAFGVVTVAVALAGAVATTAEPTGYARADAFWSAALVGVVAFFGATARRWTWFLPAGAAVVAGADLALACAAVATVVSFVSVLRDTRSRARGALVAGLGVIGLLRAEPIGFHGLTALLTAAAVLPVVVSGHAHAGRRVKARVRRVALVLGGIVGLMLVGAAIGVMTVLDDLTDGMRAVDDGLEAARDADDEQAAAKLDEAARALAMADDTLSSWFVSPAKTLPIVGPNIDAVSSLAARASDVAGVSSLAATTADVDALRFVDGRLDPQAVRDMQGPLTEVRDAVVNLRDEIDEARSPWLVDAVSSRIDELERQVDEAVPDAQYAVHAVNIAPDLLGADGPKRYLVLFTTPVEARGRVGFPGNYAELVLDDGKLSMPVFGRVSELEQFDSGAPRQITSSPEFVARYGRFDVADTWRNITMTPDFVTLAHVAAELYPQSGGQPVDGVLTVDPTGLAAIMRYTGDVHVEGLPTPLTSENVEQYLLFDQYVQFADDNEQRVDLLEDVARTTFERLTNADLPGPRKLSEHLDPVVDGGHIQFTTFDETSALVLTGFGVTGYIPPPDNSDSILLTTTNAGASKIDVFLRRSEAYEVHWNPETGEVRATLRVTLENTAPAEGLPDYVIGNSVGLPNGFNRSYVSMYSPFDLEAARIDGQPAMVQAEREMQRNVYSTFVDIPPGGSVQIELDLVGTITGRRYRLDLPAQPFVDPDDVAVAVTVEGGATAASREAQVDGNVATWISTLDLPRTLTVTAPRG